MYASHPRPGAICGWSPSDDDHDSLYTTIPTAAHPGSTVSTQTTEPSASTPRALRNTMQRSLSLDSDIHDEYDDDDVYNLSRFKNATSIRRYKAKRARDPNWAPRPPNAFILFRREYAKEHKGETTATEKVTLSKRAGEAWKALSGDEQRKYFDQAKAEADEHIRQHPNYQFKPNKHSRSESRRHPALLSRRQQVEEFVRQTSRRRTVSRVRRSRDRSATPGSAGTATSPEPPGTPASHASSSQFDSNSRSSSHTRQPQVACPVPLVPGNEHGFYSVPAVQSTPSLIIDPLLGPPLKRAYSYSEGDAEYSPWQFLTFEEGYSEGDIQSINSVDSGHGAYSPIPQASPDEYSASMPEPTYMPTSDLSSSSQPAASTSYIPPTPGPLFERRKRAATTSMIPSPLTVITSSLSGWARDDQMTARMIPRGDMAPLVPSHPQSAPVTQMAEAQLFAPLPPPTLSAPQINITEDWSQPMQAAPECDNVLTVSMADVDLERTPRVPVFPQNTQTVFDYSQHPTSSQLMLSDLEYPTTYNLESSPSQVLPMDPFDLTADLESYNMGLRNYGIGMSQETFGTPGLDDTVDYNSLFQSAGIVGEQN